jgi:hypothetical protein
MTKSDYIHYENITFLLSYKINHVSMRVCVLKEYLGSKNVFFYWPHTHTHTHTHTHYFVSISSYIVALIHALSYKTTER